MAGLPTEILHAPLHVFRPQDLADRYTQPSVQVHRLLEQGRIRRVAPGYYYALRDGASTDWLPRLESIAAGVATALYGDRVPVLMHLSAARIHGASPRALATAVVAVPRQHPPFDLVDRDAGRIVFVKRDVDALDAELVDTDLGAALVSTPEQTVVDLGRRPELLDLREEVASAVRAVIPRCDEAVLEGLAARQNGREGLRRARSWVAGAEPR